MIFLAMTVLLILSTSRKSRSWILGGSKYGQRQPTAYHLTMSRSAISVGRVAEVEDKLLSQWRSMNLSPKSTVLLSVSGGSDSIAMLHMMQSLRMKNYPDLDLKVICFNHKVRAAADEEAEFVASIASKYGMQMFHRCWPSALDNRSNFQDKARIWRKAESLALLNSFNNPYGRFISTAHHRDDQLETIVMKLLRGTFIANIRGMVSHDGVFIKPLLSFSKEELVTYLKTNEFDWREDVSNQSRDYKRNKVRLDLIPLLSELSGGINALENRLSALMEQSSLLKPILDTQVAQQSQNIEYRKYWDGYFTLIFKSDPKQLPKLILMEIIHAWVLEKSAISLNYSMLQSVAKLFNLLGSKKSVKATITKDWDISLVGSELRLMKRSSQFSMDSNRTILKKRGLELVIHHPSFLSFEANDPGNEYRKISFPVPTNITTMDITIKFPDNGERLPSKYGEGPKINTLAFNNGVPTHDRDRALLLHHDDKPILIIFPQQVILSGEHLQKVNDSSSGLKWTSFYLKSNHQDTVPDHSTGSVGVEESNFQDCVS